MRVGANFSKTKKAKILALTAVIEVLHQKTTPWREELGKVEASMSR